MIHPGINAIPPAWVRQVRDALRVRGYYYEPEFCAEADAAAPVLAAARLLGRLYVPVGTDLDRPVILTQPSPSAPNWRPFDRRESIGWHNDFSTRPGRPVLSLSLIRRGDPDEQNGGAWRVASVADVLSKLCRTPKGEEMVSDLTRRAEPFGYRDAGSWYPFRLIIRVDGRPGTHGLRFYGRALEEGAWLRFGRVPDRTREIITRLQKAADSVGEVLRAPTGALMIVDNRFSLHDRLQQRVNGSKDRRRQAWLCFVQRLHEPL
jgi:hypothetical protein